MLKKLGKDVAIYGSADLLFRLTQFLVIPVYAHLLSVADFGILALLTVSATLLGMLLNLGVNNSVQRYYFDPGTPDSERPALVSTGLFQLCLTGLAVTAAAFLLLYNLRDGIQAAYRVEWLLVVLALLTVLPEQLAQYTLDAVRLQFQPLRFCAIAMVKNLFGVLLGLWFLLGWDMGIAGLLLGPLLAAVAAVPLGLLMIKGNLALRFDAAVARKVFHYGYPFVFAGAAYWVFGSMDRWMLAELSDVVQVGLFSMGFKLAGVLTFVISAFSQAWSPFAFRMHRDDPAYRENYSRILSAWFFLLALTALGIALFAPEAMMLLTPPEYWPAIPVVALGAAGLAVYGTTQVTVLGISLEKRTILLTYGAWIAAFANVLLNLFLIPRFGATGAALSTFLSYAVLTATFLFWSQRLHPIPLERGKLAYSGATVIVTAASVLLLGATGISAALIAAKLAFLAAAMAGAYWVGIVDRSHLAALRALLRRGSGISPPGAGLSTPSEPPDRP